ncbi:hypothetical protein [Mycobacteroides abscessus]|uniref:hypothetical protein n=1 Tax=Mycobacteroides abscessus TaxID=36809 RepID=UPI0013FCFF7E|nr:hypothetical protein [Mycobacteroides abscessus]
MTLKRPALSSGKQFLPMVPFLVGQHVREITFISIQQRPDSAIQRKHLPPQEVGLSLR